MALYQSRSRDMIYRDQVEYLISNQHTKKELDPHIHILNGNYNIKEKSTLYLMVANNINKTHHI